MQNTKSCYVQSAKVASSNFLMTDRHITKSKSAKVYSGSIVNQLHRAICNNLPELNHQLSTSSIFAPFCHVAPSVWQCYLIHISFRLYSICRAYDFIGRVAVLCLCCEFLFRCKWYMI